MEEINLDFLKDCDGKYIVRNEIYDTNFNPEINVHTSTDGVFICNTIISNKYFEKKLRHYVVNIVRNIRESFLKKNKLVEQDIYSEKFLLECINETELNPLFTMLSNKEIKALTKNSTKVQLKITWNICAKNKPKLVLASFKTKFKKLFK